MIPLRAARPEDAAAIAAIYRAYVLGGAISFEDAPPDAAAMRARMAEAGELYPWLVAEDEAGAVAAYAYAGPWSPRSAYRWTVETTIYVAEQARGRGLGRPLYRALLATLAAQGFAQAIGRISLPNLASVALHDALGFRCVGTTPAVGRKKGRWIDVALWQRPLADSAEPAPPRAFAEVGLVRD